MVGQRKKREEDSTIHFSRNPSAGVLVQHRLRRCLYFIKGQRIDTLYFEGDTTASEIEEWIQSKRKHYLAQMGETIIS